MNNRNYQKELDRLIEDIAGRGVRPRLLIHSCCAPCSSYVMEYLSRYFDLTMFFYNPNMDSLEEYIKRANELRRLIDETGMSERIRLVISDYTPEDFESIAAGHEQDPERGERCLRCYRLRLEKTASYMQSYNLTHPEEKYDYFATTLTLSPLKSAEALNDIALQLSEQYSVKCLETDFKKRGGYKRSIELSKEYGLYRQDYCGCRYSKRAAELRRASKLAMAE